MPRVSDQTLATVDLLLSWKSREAVHEERFLARKMNLWRDILPLGLKHALTGLGAGESVSVAYAAGEAMPDRQDALVQEVPHRCFTPRIVAGRTVSLRAGRHYPRGLFGGLPGIFPQDARPARILDAGDDQEARYVLDLNHPLAGRPFRLDATVLNVAEKKSDTGGRLSDWLEEICCFGPGMQARRGDFSPTDFTPPDGEDRLDNEDDARFYARPRLIGHIDAQASALLSENYARRIPRGARVLDLMSSVQSHLPLDADLDVTGLGMNMEELAANPLLSARVVQDLNRDGMTPFGDAGFDAVVCSLSVEYLLDPARIVRECARVLRPGGLLLFGFSNRWFPTKATPLWLDLHEFERMGLVLEYLLASGDYADLWTFSARNWWRPVDDPHIRQTWTSDPVYVVGGRRTS